MAKSDDKEYWIGEQCWGDLRSCKEIDRISGRIRFFLAKEVQLRADAAAAGAPIYRTGKDERALNG